MTLEEYLSHLLAGDEAACLAAGKALAGTWVLPHYDG